MDSIGGLILQLGVGGIFAILVLREVFSFLSNKKLPKNVSSDHELLSLLREVNETVDTLHEMHNIKDTDGVYTWFIPRAWGGVQKEIALCQQRTVEICRDISNTQITIARSLDRIESKLDKQLD